MKLFESLITRLPIMTDYMTQNDDNDSTDPFETTEFDVTRTPRLRTMPGDKATVEEYVIENVEKIYRTVKSRDTINTAGPDETPQRVNKDRRGRMYEISTDHSVVRAMNVPSDRFDKRQMYYLYAGVIAAEIDELRWQSAYNLDMSEAVNPDSEEFVSVASKFNIDTSNHRKKYLPRFIKAAYSTIYNRAESSGRPVHKWELEFELGSLLADYQYKDAYRYLERLPGVEPPSQTVAWEFVEQSELSGMEDTASNGKESAKQ